jgi:hypothetical protein
MAFIAIRIAVCQVHNSPHEGEVMMRYRAPFTGNIASAASETTTMPVTHTPR